MSESQFFTGVCYLFDMVFAQIEIIIKLVIQSGVVNNYCKQVNNNKTKFNMLMCKSAFIFNC